MLYNKIYQNERVLIMKLKRVFAALLAAVLLLSCVPFAANAAGKAHVPTELYVGEKDKTEHNLIERLANSNGSVKVIAIDTETESYYELTKEDGVGYVLTFYKNYRMSEMVDSSAGYCGLYCDGDLTVRIAGDVTFDANDIKKRGACGWIVEGELTIEGQTKTDKGEPVPRPRLTVYGSKPKDADDECSIGIRAKTLKLHRLEVVACGGYAAVKVDDTLVMGYATLYANTTEDMNPLGIDNFTYSIDAWDTIMFGGYLKACGLLKVDGFYFKEGSNAQYDIDKRVVVYRKDFNFQSDSYSGKFNDKLKLFKNYKDIPECLDIFVTPEEINRVVAKISGNDITMYRTGWATITVSVRCGSETLTLDVADVHCTLKWYQWIPYIFDVIVHGKNGDR